MKTVKLILALLIATAGLAVSAGTPELVASMRRQQKESEQKIVKLWLANQRGAELEAALNEYVVRQVRLRSLGGKTDDTLLDAVIGDDQDAPESPQALATALIIEHFRRQGVDIAGQAFVAGTYHIRRDNGAAEPAPAAGEE